MSDLSEVAERLGGLLDKFILEYEGGKYYDMLVSSIKKDVVLQLDRRDVYDYDPMLAEYFRHYPKDFLNVLEEIASKILPSDKKLYITVIGLPEMSLRQIVTAENVSKLVAFKGIVTKSTNPKPMLRIAHYFCPSCGHIEEIEYPTGKPPKCPECKTTMVLDLKRSVFEDVQAITVQERSEDVPTGSTPTSIDCLLKRPLIDKANPGDVVKIIGILKYAPIEKPKFKLGGALDLYVEVLGIEVGNVEDASLEPTEEELEYIRHLIRTGKAVEVVKNSIAPGIKGYEDVKEAIAYQLFGGVNKRLPDGTTIRGNIHILLIGDPGIGKSQILRSVSNLAPRAILTSGESSTGAGLTVAAVRTDEGFELEAGALVLADEGIACIDEFDKMRREDREKLHEAMEQQSFHPDTEILLTNGERKRIGELVDSLMLMFQDSVEKTENGEYLEIPPFVAITIPSNTLMASAPMRVTRVSRHKSPKYLYKIRLETGEEVIVMPDHPFIVFSGEEIEIVPAKSLKPGDRIPATQDVFIYERPGTINENLARLMARFLIDGVLGERTIAIKRVPKEFDEIDRERIKENFYDAIIKEEEDYIRIRSTTLMDYLRDNCEELFDGRVPAALVRESPPVIEAFLKEFLTFSYGQINSYELAKDIQLLFSRLGVPNKISKIGDGKYTIEFFLDRPEYREVESIERIESDAEYVYDILVEPTHIIVTGSGLLMHNSISVSKAGISARLNARTAILAAANPKYGRFVEGKPIDDQIDMPPTILSRFDLIFPIRDIIDEKHDREIARKIVETRSMYDIIKPELPPALIKKRIYYAKKYVKPKIPKRLIRKIEDFYVKIRKSSIGKAVRITPRQLESILRIAEARARLHLRDEVNEEDIEASIRLVTKFINDVLGGDIDVIYGMPRDRREKAMKIDDAIIKVLEENPEGLRERELIEEVKSLTGADEDKIRKHIHDLYEIGKITKAEGYYML